MSFSSLSSRTGELDVGYEPADVTCEPLSVVVLYILLAGPVGVFFIFIGNYYFSFASVALLAFPFKSFLVARNLENDHSPISMLVVVFVLLFFISLVITTLGGGGRLFPATSDWLIRDAVLNDLASQAWPFVYNDGGHSLLLRASLGMYMLPAIVGKVFGVYAAHIALWMQNTIALFSVLIVVTFRLPLRKRLFVVASFVLFSGFDIVGAALAGVKRDGLMGFGGIDPNLEWWAGTFQYSSHITMMLWVPNHALAGWFFVSLLLLWDQKAIRIGAVVVAAGLSMFWSPLAFLGAIPFVLKAGIESLIERRIRSSDVILALLAGVSLLPVLMYMVSGSDQVGSGFQPFGSEFFTRYTTFIVIEVAPFVLVNLLLPSAGPFRHSTYVAAVVVLLVIPFYYINVTNDFAMRASIPALAVVALQTAHTLWNAFANGRRSIAWVMIAMLLIGSLTGLNEIRRAAGSTLRNFSTCDVVEAWAASPYGLQPNTHYLTDPAELPDIIRPTRFFKKEPSSDPRPCAVRTLSAAPLRRASS